MRVDEIWINELVTYQNFYGTLERILRLKRAGCEAPYASS